jgi:hypothetical protein
MFELFISYILGFLTLAIVKSISEPIALRFGRLALGRAHQYLPQIFDALDYDWLPKNNIQSAYDWLIKTCIPQNVPLELSQDEIKVLADYVIKEFDLETFLRKQFVA